MHTFLDLPVIVLCVLLAQATAFSPLSIRQLSSLRVGSTTARHELVNVDIADPDVTVDHSIGNHKLMTLTGFLSGAVLLTPEVLAEMEVEMADLPPPWIPVVFGLALLGGIGLLTGSLGDVMNEESLLGMQSGARAKKDIERSRSSYFKKK